MLFAEGTGQLWDTAHQPLTLDGNTQFEIGSITKVFTSMVQYIKNPTPYGGQFGDFFIAGDPLAERGILPDPVGESDV